MMWPYWRVQYTALRVTVLYKIKKATRFSVLNFRSCNSTEWFLSLKVDINRSKKYEKRTLGRFRFSRGTWWRYWNFSWSIIKWELPKIIENFLIFEFWGEEPASRGVGSMFHLEIVAACFDNILPVPEGMIWGWFGDCFHWGTVWGWLGMIPTILGDIPSHPQRSPASPTIPSGIPWGCFALRSIV